MTRSEHKFPILQVLSKQRSDPYLVISIPIPDPSVLFVLKKVGDVFAQCIVDNRYVMNRHDAQQVRNSQLQTLRTAARAFLM